MKSRLAAGCVFLLTIIWSPHAQSFEQSVLDKAELIKSEFAKWLKSSDARAASLAISNNGNYVGGYEHNRSVDEPAPVASLSKIITGSCILQLAREGELNFESPISKIVPELASEVSIAELLTHTSGYKKDITQTGLRVFSDFSKEYLIQISKAEILAAGNTELKQSFKYNNSNYAMLGAAISRLKGSSYEAACAKLALSPLGIRNAHLNPGWRIMSSWGGWSISSRDYLTFVDTFFDQNQVNGRSPFDVPFESIGGGTFYGTGYLFRHGRNGQFNYWHFGSWEWKNSTKDVKFGAYFAKWDNGWAVSANYDIATDVKLAGNLDHMLASAALGKN
ncbi:MAG: serine hydrolase domain-containing protein [Pseudomonadota bacterium]